MSSRFDSCQYAVVGAGPYGMAVASHLRFAGLDVRIFGKVMDFWDRHMPKGMKLRSPLEGSHIADPQRELTLEHYGAAHGKILDKSLPLEEFVGYGRWYQSRALTDLDSRNVNRIDRADDGFNLTLEDGDNLSAHNVVIATGIGAFAHAPPPFASLPRDLVSHTSDPVNRDLSRFDGRRVVVVGSGQSALESAALLHETGAQVEVLARQPQLRYLRDSGLLEWVMDCRLNPFRAPGKIGPIGINWLIEHPGLFTLFPRRLQNWMTRRSIRSAGSSWLRPRNQGMTFTTGRQAMSAAEHGDRICMHLDDGSQREADHVLLGTGYKIDIARYSFLPGELLQAVRTVNGYPTLNAGFESSVPGLYFVGTTAAYSFGPLCRFVAGTPYTAAALAKYARKKPATRRLVAARV